MRSISVSHPFSNSLTDSLADSLTNWDMNVSLSISRLLDHKYVVCIYRSIGQLVEGKPVLDEEEDYVSHLLEQFNNQHLNNTWKVLQNQQQLLCYQ